jgi:hypothetical protein
MLLAFLIIFFEIETKIVVNTLIKRVQLMLSFGTHNTDHYFLLVQLLQLTVLSVMKVSTLLCTLKMKQR